jgi:putative hydrolase of HD superfamily
MSHPNDQSKLPAAASSASAAIDFLTLTRKLKTTKRTGWIMRGVPNPESIADHMYRMSLMAMISSFSNTTINTNRCIKLALIHDLAEAKVGDITPHCGVSDKEKYELELKTMEHISEMLGPLLGGEEILGLWKEYEEGVTEEARLLKDLDKIEMILQAQEYEVDGGHEKSLDQFFTSTEGKWRTEVGKAWAAEIVSRRKGVGKDDGNISKENDGS